MERWTGEAIPMQVGCEWTYKLRLREEGGKSALVLGQKKFPTREEAQAAGEEHLKAEAEKLSA